MQRANLRAAVILALAATVGGCAPDTTPKLGLRQLRRDFPHQPDDITNGPQWLRTPDGFVATRAPLRAHFGAHAEDDVELELDDGFRVALRPVGMSAARIEDGGA